MSKKDFIALAEAIRDHRGTRFTQDQLDTLADFCRGQNYNFMRERWIGYIRGENGPSGGAITR
jgi:hypothetical protein